MTFQLPRTRYAIRTLRAGPLRGNAVLARAALDAAYLAAITDGGLDEDDPRKEIALSFLLLAVTHGEPGISPSALADFMTKPARRWRRETQALDTQLNLIASTARAQGETPPFSNSKGKARTGVLIAAAAGLVSAGARDAKGASTYLTLARALGVPERNALLVFQHTLDDVGNTPFMDFVLTLTGPEQSALGSLVHGGVHAVLSADGDVSPQEAAAWREKQRALSRLDVGPSKQDALIQLGDGFHAFALEPGGHEHERALAAGPGSLAEQELTRRQIDVLGKLPLPLRKEFDRCLVSLLVSLGESDSGFLGLGKKVAREEQAAVQGFLRRYGIAVDDETLREKLSLSGSLVPG